MGLSLDAVVAEGTSIGENGSLTRGRSWCRLGNEGDVGEGWLFLRKCRCSGGLLLLFIVYGRFGSEVNTIEGRIVFGAP